eukprot:10574051-Ditylum_brightwellii.AAC.1
MSSIATPLITIGMVVRAPRRKGNQIQKNKKEELFLSKATVVTLDIDDAKERKASILWDDLAPQPILCLDDKTKKRASFLITPTFPISKEEEEEEELLLSDILPLLSFEQQQQVINTAKAEEHKQWGDELFKLRDISSA